MVKIIKTAKRLIGIKKVNDICMGNDPQLISYSTERLIRKQHLKILREKEEKERERKKGEELIEERIKIR